MLNVAVATGLNTGDRASDMHAAVVVVECCPARHSVLSYGAIGPQRGPPLCGDHRQDMRHLCGVSCFDVSNRFEQLGRVVKLSMRHLQI